jgi:hypothetical protein
MDPNKKPSLYPENIPEELKKCPQWVLYRVEHNPKRPKPTKIPIQIDGNPASTSNPKTWNSFETAMLALQEGIGDGLGFVFTDKDSYTGIDLDSACDPYLGISEEWASKIVANLSSYTEYSPSETGLHIIIKAKKSINASRKGKIEIYDRARFFTFTGNIYNKSINTINERQKELDILCKKVFSSDEQIQSSFSLPEGNKLSDQEIKDLILKMRSAQNGEKFSLLFEGRWVEIKDDKDQQQYPSQSEADQALCNILAFWADNPIAIDQVFRRSSLYREKWERKDYREKTIKNAFIYKTSPAKTAFDSVKDCSVIPNNIPLIHISQVEEKPIEFQIEQIWPINSVGFISGQPGSFKTWFSLNIALSIASGSPFLGKYKCKKGKVIIFNAEDTQTQTKLRIAAFAREKGLNIDNLEIYLMDIYALSLNDKNTQEAIMNTLLREQPSFIILDPLRNIHTLNEDNSTEMVEILNFLRLINRKYNCSILLVCHDKKPAKEATGNRAAQVRGTSAIVGWRDNAIYLNLGKSSDIGIEIYNRGCKSITPFFVIPMIKNDDCNNPIKAHFQVSSKEQIELEKEREIIAELKAIIAEKGPISRNHICKLMKRQRTTVLNTVKILLDLKEIKETDKGLIISNIFDI